MGPRRLGGGQDQGPHQVDVVIVVLALQHRGQALQPHAGVDGGPRQRDALLLGQLLELHEDQVPDLDEAVAIGIRAARRAARNLVAMVVEDLRAGTAGTGIAHGPEVVAGGDADDLLLRQSCDAVPEIEGVVVLGIDGDQEAILRQAELARDQIPGQLDRMLLEIVAEGEIAQHLEEGVVARRIADILQVVVLAAGAHAFLRRGGAAVVALLGPGEDVLELHHPGIGEHQGRIVARHERTRGHDGVSVGREIVEKAPANVVDALHHPRSGKSMVSSRSMTGTGG